MEKWKRRKKKGENRKDGEKGKFKKKKKRAKGQKPELTEEKLERGIEDKRAMKGQKELEGRI